MDLPPKSDSLTAVEGELKSETSKEKSRFPNGRNHIYEPTETMAELFDILGKKHTPAILYAFACGAGPWRFTELQEMLDVAPNSLATRLKELTNVGLLTRRSFDEIPPRVEYENTQKARDLRAMFEEIHLWSEEHDLE